MTIFRMKCKNKNDIIMELQKILLRIGFKLFKYIIFIVDRGAKDPSKIKNLNLIKIFLLTNKSELKSRLIKRGQGVILIED